MIDEKKDPKETPPEDPSKSPEVAAKPAPPPEPSSRAGPVHPSPDAPPPPPPVPPVTPAMKDAGPPAWMAPVAVLLLVAGLASFACSAYSYVSGVSAKLHAGNLALLSVKALDDANTTPLDKQSAALAARAMELRREAIAASGRAETQYKAARIWGFGGIVPLIVGLILMVVYRKKRASARARRVR